MPAHSGRDPEKAGQRWAYERGGTSLFPLTSGLEGSKVGVTEGLPGFLSSEVLTQVRQDSDLTFFLNPWLTLTPYNLSLCPIAKYLPVLVCDGHRDTQASKDCTGHMHTERAAKCIPLQVTSSHLTASGPLRV